MPDSYPFPIYSGLLEPRHYKSIGSAVWLFLWCISSTTKELEKDGITWGIVLGNKPIKCEELAEQFDVEEKTVRRWIKQLEEQGYIRVTRAPYGMIFTVRNSKKFQNSPDKNVHSPPERVDRNVQSDRREWTEMSSLVDKNVHSNKDITGDITVKDLSVLPSSEIAQEKIESIDLGDGVPSTDSQSEISPFKQIEDRYLLRRAFGLDLSGTDIAAIRKVLEEGVPVGAVLTGIDKAFEQYKPRFEGDRIKTFNYCLPVIREHHYLESTRKEAAAHGLDSDQRSSQSGRASPPRGGGTSTRSPIGQGYYDQQYPGLIQSL
ncbi:HTH domain-containing protein [Paenibacillus lycopersici]|uniref:HTH domain-containing protein n=1 Tax=Paenibacillus lycopersici TaxID=2704462 RepID=A0A6C0FU22_9BACL|nr:HTH domain-containing protein [Paenibacillus lycopersici]QHT60648.1 HTH domain-containing protein [Paenibacillus lycopersici]